MKKETSKIKVFYPLHHLVVVINLELNNCSNVSQQTIFLKHMIFYFTFDGIHAFIPTLMKLNLNISILL
jgi:hypothetical protein